MAWTLATCNLVKDMMHEMVLSLHHTWLSKQRNGTDSLFFSLIYPRRLIGLGGRLPPRPGEEELHFPVARTNSVMSTLGRVG